MNTQQKEKKIIPYDSPEAASFKTVTGWVSSDGIFCGNDEHVARYRGCTHIKCNESYYTKIANDTQEQVEFQDDKSFVKWLTDRQEYEV